MKRVGIFCLLLLFLCLLFILLNSNHSSKSAFSAQEKKQAMAKILDREPVLEEKAQREWQTFTGKYIQFSYPTDAKIYKKNSYPSVLEQFSCGIFDPRLNLTVQVVAGQSLDESPGVMLRQDQKEVYNEKEENIKGNHGVVFTKDVSDGAEKTGFFVKDGKIFSIAVTGFQLDAVADLYEEVLASVEL